MKWEREHMENESCDEPDFELPDVLIVNTALETVRSEFSAKYRKAPPGHPPPTYVPHLIEVGSILAAHNYSPFVVAAGLLHDLVEEIPSWSYDRMRTEFGKEVALLVRFVTHPDSSLPWEHKWRKYVQLVGRGPRDVRAIACADKISNIRATIPFLKKAVPLQSYLSRGWRFHSEKLWELERLFPNRVHPHLYATFLAALEEFDRLGRRSELR